MAVYTLHKAMLCGILRKGGLAAIQYQKLSSGGVGVLCMHQALSSIGWAKAPAAAAAAVAAAAVAAAAAAAIELRGNEACLRLLKRFTCRPCMQYY